MDFFPSISLSVFLLFAIDEDDEVDFVDEAIEVMVVRFLVVESFEGSFSFDEDEGEAERYERVVVVDEAGEEILSLRWS